MAAEAGAKGAVVDAQGGKKSKKMLFIIMGLGIVLLGGGGFFAYTKLMKHKPAIEETSHEAPKEKEHPAGHMMMLEPFVVNLADPTGKRYLRMIIGLELENKEGADKAEKIVPKLRDTVIMMITSLTFEEVMTPEGKLQIRDELLERINQAMRPSRVLNIYFTEFVVQ